MKHLSDKEEEILDLAEKNSCRIDVNHFAIYQVVDLLTTINSLREGINIRAEVFKSQQLIIQAMSAMLIEKGINFDFHKDVEKYENALRAQRESLK